MFLDSRLAEAWRFRTARDPGVETLVGAWSGASLRRRAAMFAAQGDLVRAGACGGKGWRQLADGDVLGALRVARGARESGKGTPEVLLECEAMFAAGAVVAALRQLQQLHRQGDATATLALARRRHILGDHQGAEAVAQALPLHAHAALTGARAALAHGGEAAARRFIEPFLIGLAPIPEPAVAGAFAIVAATLLAREGAQQDLQRFAANLLATPDLAEDMMPTVARTAWTAGLGQQAWQRFNDANNPWMTAGRLELATLAGDADLAVQLMHKAGPLGAPAKAALLLLRGDPPKDADAVGEELFTAGRSIHVWRTHPHRWQPWIDAALQSPAAVELFDLAANRLPDEQAVPAGVLDDGALVGLLAPAPVAKGSVQGSGVWIEAPLCQGVGVGHDWPEEETRSLAESVDAAPRTKAAVWVLGAESALARAHEGKPTVVVAPPGDPFWAGPLPEQAWPAFRVVRADARTGWAGAGKRAGELARGLQQGGDR